MYVDSLIALLTVNTMPLATLKAVAEHGHPDAGFSSRDIVDPRELPASLGSVGIDFADVTATVEREGSEKFAASFDELLLRLLEKVQSERRR